jgi:Protein of unknown function (DUF3037)
MHRTYDFATIGFRPFPETQEFVTMGVVAIDTATRQFDFVLQDARKTGRILAMFPKAGKPLYKEARAKLEVEMLSIRNAVNGQGPGGNVPLFPVFRETEGGLFAAITSPREGVFCFPVKGRRLAADMPTVLEALKVRFIDQREQHPRKSTNTVINGFPSYVGSNGLATARRGASSPLVRPRTKPTTAVKPSDKSGKN